MLNREQCESLLETIRKEIGLRETMINNRVDFERYNPDATIEQIKKNQMFIEKQKNIRQYHIECYEIISEMRWG